MKYLAYGLVGGAAVVAAVWLAERVGGRTGGVIATAPTVVLVAYILYCSAHGTEKSAAFSWGAVRGLVATGVFMLVLGLLPARCSMPVRLGIASGTWLVLALLLAK